MNQPCPGILLFRGYDLPFSKQTIIDRASDQEFPSGLLFSRPSSKQKSLDRETSGLYRQRQIFHNGNQPPLFIESSSQSGDLGQGVAEFEIVDLHTVIQVDGQALGG